MMRLPPTTAPNARLLTGISGFAVAALIVIEAGIRITLGVRPSLDDGPALAEFAFRTSTQTLLITLADTLMMAVLVVFFAGFRQLITVAEGEIEWVTAIILGAGLVFIGATLVGDSLEAGGALGALSSSTDPTVIRTLTEGYLLLFGPVSYVLIALVSATSGWVVLVSKALPRWVGFLAWAVTALNIVAISTVFGGTDNRDFYSVGGWGGAVFATFPWLVWVFVVSLESLRARHRDRRSAAGE